MIKDFFNKENVVSECDKFDMKIQMAIGHLKTHHLEEAMAEIKSAQAERPDSAKVQNLLGIYAEKIGQMELASRHYRASYALDPTYAPAKNNLERITDYHYSKRTEEPDYDDSAELARRVGAQSVKSKVELKKILDYNYVIIVGCSGLGANIATMMSMKGISVVILDKNPNAFRKLSDSYSGYRIEADATDIDELIEAGIEKADLVVVATDEDNINIMVSQIAKRIYKVKTVISRLYDSSKEPIYHRHDIDLIYPSKLSVNEFEKLSSESWKEV